MKQIDVTALAAHIYRGPFHARQKQAGASFYEDMGALWTKGFGPPAAEYWAVRCRTGLWDVSSLVKFRFDGPQALSALERISTRRLRNVAPGTLRYGLVLDERGYMLDEATFLVTAPTQGYLLGNDEREPFIRHLHSVTADLDVEITNVSRKIPTIAIQGPDSFQMLTGLIDRPFSDLRWFQGVPEVSLMGVRGMLIRAGYTGELGYEFYFLDGEEGAEGVWDKLVGAGAEPIGLDAIEPLRCELGYVLQGEDYVPGQTDPLDLSLERFVEFDDHEFIGKAALAARLAAGPLRRLKTLILEGSAVPESGAPVLRDGCVVGKTTSAALSPRFGLIALSVLDRDHAIDGAPVRVGDAVGKVCLLPLDTAGRVRSNPRQPTRLGRGDGFAGPPAAASPGEGKR